MEWPPAQQLAPPRRWRQKVLSQYDYAQKLTGFCIFYDFPLTFSWNFDLFFFLFADMKSKLYLSMPRIPPKIYLKTVNPHITCNLCKGYLINATTIVECLHSCKCRQCRKWKRFFHCDFLFGLYWSFSASDHFLTQIFTRSKLKKKKQMLKAA